MNEGDIRSHVLDLVGLQVSDEMPFDVLREDFVLHGHFLYLAFSEYTLATLVCLLEGFYGVELRYGYQAYAFGKFCLDALDFFLNVAHNLFYASGNSGLSFGSALYG